MQVIEFEVGQRVEFYQGGQNDLGTVTAVKETEHAYLAQVEWDDGTDTGDAWFEANHIRPVPLAPRAVAKVPYDDLPRPYDLLGATQTFMLRAKQLESTGWNPEYDSDLRSFRRRLLDEEIKEWKLADDLNDPVEYADGLADIIVTAVGALFALFGTERASRILQEVGVTNLDKVRPGNIRLREGDNKVLKPVDWIGPPDIASILGCPARKNLIEKPVGPIHDDDREAGWG